MPRAIWTFIGYSGAGRHGAIVREALAAKGAMTTKELVDELMKARKLPTGDRVMNRTLGQKLSQLPRQTGIARQAEARWQTKGCRYLAVAGRKNADLSEPLKVLYQYKTPDHYDASKRQEPIMDVESKYRGVVGHEF